mgnify:CR=1 FL=1
MNDTDWLRFAAPPEALQAEFDHPELKNERVRLVERRTHIDSSPVNRDRPAVGLALSGGGIRSATFSLGLLRALGQARLIPRIDYLSTVSGGSYIGSYLCSLYVPRWRRGDQPGAKPTGCSDDTLPAKDGDPFDCKRGEASILHLRNSGRHLLPGGVGDVVQVAAIMIRNWAAIHFVIGITLLAFFMLLKPVQVTLLACGGLAAWEAARSADWPALLFPSQWLQGLPVARFFIASPLLAVAAAPLLLTLASGCAFWLTRRSACPLFSSRLLRSLFGPASLGLFLLMGAAGFIAAYAPEYSPNLPQAVPAAWLVIMVGALAFLVLAFFQIRDAVASAPASPGLSQRIKSWFGDLRGGMAVLQVSGWAAAVKGRVRAIPPVLAWGSAAEGRLRALSKEQAERYANARLVMQEDSVRSRITWFTSTSLAWALTLLLLGLFDSAAQTIYLRLQELLTIVVGGGLSLALIVPVARQALISLVGAGQHSARLKTLAASLARFGHAIALVAGLALATAVGLFWAVVAHAIAWQGGPVGYLDAWGVDAGTANCVLWAIAGVLVAAAWMVAGSTGFLNMSSLSSFYASRLRRAYLGASNPDRHAQLEEIKEGEKRLDDMLDENFPLDDIAPTANGYYADDVLAPLHLINVTINDTVGGSSNLTRQDRRGKPLTVSPAGILHAAETAGRLAGHAAVGEEDLPLSSWVAISGAAFSTGIGRFGSTGMALLAGLTNLRTGYWWTTKSRTNELLGFPSPSRSVQNYLRREFLGRFRGTDSRRWYLSDGGHFENMGVFELIRRRVPFIIAADCGADPNYEFGDLTNLIRLARIEFDVEIDILKADALDDLFGRQSAVRQLFGALSDLARASDPKTPALGPYAALAHLRDGAGATWGTLLLVKPRLCGAEMADLLAYRTQNPAFPQQSTGDQFFDEAQWESYQRLGRLIGEQLFRDHAAGTFSPPRWQPRDLRPLDIQS